MDFMVAHCVLWLCHVTVEGNSQPHNQWFTSPNDNICTLMP